MLIYPAGQSASTINAGFDSVLAADMDVLPGFALDLRELGRLLDE